MSDCLRDERGEGRVLPDARPEAVQQARRDPSVGVTHSRIAEYVHFFALVPHRIRNVHVTCACAMWLQAWRSEWPRLDEAHAAAIDIVQHEGEVIFIPSGWYHQVTCLVILA